MFLTTVTFYLPPRTWVRAFEKSKAKTPPWRAPWNWTEVQGPRHPPIKGLLELSEKSTRSKDHPCCGEGSLDFLSGLWVHVL